MATWVYIFFVEHLLLQVIDKWVLGITVFGGRKYASSVFISICLCRSSDYKSKQSRVVIRLEFWVSVQKNCYLLESEFTPAKRLRAVHAKCTTAWPHLWITTLPSSCNNVAHYLPRHVFHVDYAVLCVERVSYNWRFTNSGHNLFMKCFIPISGKDKKNHYKTDYNSKDGRTEETAL